MAIKFNHEKGYAQQLMDAMQSNDQEKINKAWESFHDSIAESVRQDFEEATKSNDAAVLAQRGFRQLTTKETKWYEKFIEAARNSNPKQAFTTLLGSDVEDDLMPESIFEDVYKNLEEEHPLLKAIGVQHVGYSTKWVLNDHTKQLAAWGEINSEISKEITSSFKVVDVTQNKLSAFAAIQLDMLDLGPVFLDAYIRRCLLEALACGLEDGIVNGTGLNQPIGLIRDIHEGVSYSTSTGYPAKAKTAVTDFSPKTYGNLVSKLAQTENGHMRRIGKLALLVNPVDYCQKIMPATTVMGTDGLYRGGVLPMPTEIIQTTALKSGDAVLFLPDEYKLLAGGRRSGAIEYSDEYKFLEDMRYFKIKQHATGKAFDDNCALYLDISNLEELYVTVKQVEVTA